MADGVLHCWAEGPYVCNAHRKPDCETCDMYLDGVSTSTTCMLESGHGGDHDFMLDSNIVVEFPATGSDVQ